MRIISIVFLGSFLILILIPPSEGSGFLESINNQCVDGIIQGKIIDNIGRPINGVTVQIRHQNSLDAILQTNSDANGEWILKVGSTNFELVRIFKPGFSEYYLQNGKDVSCISSSTLQHQTSTTNVKKSQLASDYEMYISDIEGAEILNIKPNFSSKSLIINIEPYDDGELTLTIPRTVFDSKISNDGKSGNDRYFDVLIGGQFINTYEENTNNERSITIPFDDRTTQIEIIGTFLNSENNELDGNSDQMFQNTECVSGTKIDGICMSDYQFYLDNNKKYHSGDILKIIGKLPTWDTNPIIVRIFSSSGTLITVDQITTAHDGSFSKEFKLGGQLYRESGKYTLTFNVGKSSGNSSFDYDAQINKIEQPYSRFSISGLYSLPYIIDGGIVKNVKVDPAILGLIVTIRADNDGILTLDLQRDLIDARVGRDGKSGEDDRYVIYINGLEAPYQESLVRPESRLIKIQFQKGDSDIEIIGTYVYSSSTSDLNEKANLSEKQCGPGAILKDGKCFIVDKQCGPGTVLKDGQCVLENQPDSSSTTGTAIGVILLMIAILVIVYIIHKQRNRTRKRVQLTIPSVITQNNQSSAKTQMPIFYQRDTPQDTLQNWEEESDSIDGQNWPTTSIIDSTFEQLQENIHDNSLVNMEVVKNDLGLPLSYPGNFATVYQTKRNNKTFAIKFFTQKKRGLMNRYKILHDYFIDKKIYTKCSYFTEFEYVPNALNIKLKEKTVRFPIIKMDWIDGVTLDELFRNEINPARFEIITEKIFEMSNELEKLKIAHGDIHPKNILVTTDDNLKLIDYDCIFIDPFKNEQMPELGDPDCQHPNRGKFTYDHKIDRFSFLVIYLATLAISKDQSIKSERVDEFLFSKEDFLNPDNSKIFARLQNMGSRINYLTLKLMKYCKEKNPNIPSLSEIAQD